MRSIHIDYIKRERERERWSIIPVYVFILCVYQQKIMTHSKLIIRVNFSLPHRSGVLEALNIIGLIEAKKKSVKIGRTIQHGVTYANQQQFT